jgi:hypothetical protein
LNVRDFLDVKVICETGSPRKAAVVLGVAQPTLGNRIAHREDQIGVPLLDTDINAVARPGHPPCADPPATMAGLFKYPIAFRSSGTG